MCRRQRPRRNSRYCPGLSPVPRKLKRGDVRIR